MRKIFIILLLFLLIWKSGFSQIDSTKIDSTAFFPSVEFPSEMKEMSSIIASDPTSIIPPSPSLEKLMQRINYPVNHFTGVTDIKIPIYTINEGGLILPISVSYHASGIRVSEVNGLVGLGWTLDAGGAISRTIMGQPDEVTAFEDPLKTASSIIPNNTDHQYLSGLEEWGNSEYDIFNYSAPTISGKFILQRDASNNLYATTIPFDPVKISQSVSSGNINYLDVYDKSGIQYRFGKSMTDGALEKEYSSAEPATTGWLLTDICSPTNSYNNITLKYLSYNESRHIPSHTEYIDSDFGNIFNYPMYLIQELPVLEQNDGFDYFGRKISEINFRSGKIIFDTNSGMLDTISVYNSNDSIIKKIVFERADYTGQTALKKLDKVKFYDSSNTTPIATYEFNYNESNIIPGTTYAIDYWGYYNGESANISLVPNMTIYDGTSTAINLGGSDRTPNETYMKACILTKIIYPTGGETIFDYEANKYFSGGSTTAGGLRIKSITDKDENGNENIKTYKYGINESGYGTLSVYPDKDYYSYRQDMLYSTGTSGNSDNYKRWICSSNPHIDLTPFGSPVVYTTVTEYIGTETQNTGKNVYLYDYNSHFITFHDTNNSSSSSKNKAYLTKWFPWKSGQLKYTTSYKNNSGVYNPVHSITNYYSIFMNQDIRGMKIYRFATLNHPGITIPADEEYFDYYFPGAITSVYNYEDYYLTTGAKKLDKTVEKIYDNLGNFVEQIYEYEYDNEDHLFPTLVKTTNSIGEIVEKHKYYPQDLPTGTQTSSSIFSSLTNANMLDRLIKEEKFINSTKVDGIINNYNSTLLPTSIYSYLTNGSYSSNIIFDQYDSKGNLRQFHKSDNINIAYLWDDTGSYVMAKVENATYSQISSYDGQICTSNSETLYNNLKVAAPGAMITTYTHKPLVGITQQTNPTGVTTYYEYDDFGRLSIVKNDDGKLLKKYDYNYAGQ